MRLVCPPRHPRGTEFVLVTPGTLIKSDGGRYYIKMEDDVRRLGHQGREYNAVNVETGGLVAFNLDTKVEELHDAEIHPYGCED